jgi:hypothetical protein
MVNRRTSRNRPKLNHQPFADLGPGHMGVG